MKQVDEKRIKELAQEALDLQNACNLCGLAQTFAKRMIELIAMGDTDETNRHFIVTLWLDKFNSLNGIQFDTNKITMAFDKAYELTKAG